MGEGEKEEVENILGSICFCQRVSALKENSPQGAVTEKML